MAMAREMAMFEYIIQVRKNGRKTKRIVLKGYSGNAAMDEMKWLRNTKYKTELGYTLELL
jgi:hypothetical protein